MKNKIILTLLAASALMLGALTASAATITSTASGGNWTAGGSWVGGNPPAVAGGDTVIIAATATINTGGNRTCAGITINGTLNMASGNTLTVNGDVSGTGTWATGSGTARTISLTGNWSFNGTSSGSAATALFTGTGNQSLSGKISTGGGVLTINKPSGSVTLGSAITVTTFTHTAGTFDASTFLLTATPTLTAGTLRAGAATWAANYSFTPTPPAGFTVEYYHANPTINAGITYQNLTFSGAGTAGASAALAVQGNLSNTGGGTLNFGANDVTLSGTVAANNIAGFTTTGTISLTKTAGTATFTGNVNGGGLTINGTGGTLNLGTGLTHTFTGNWTRTAGILNGGSSTVKFGGSVSGAAGTFTASAGTVEWNAAGGQTIAAVTYSNLVLSGSGAKSMPAGTAINGILSIAPSGGGATASIAAGQNLAVYGLTLGGTPQVSGTWGSTISGATHQDNTYFAATTGFVTVSGPRLLVTLPGQTFTPGSGNSGTVNNQTAGASFNLTLTAVDPANNIDTSFTGAKTVSYSGPANAPSGGGTPTYTTTVTFTAGQAASVATTLVKAETTTITATIAGLTAVPSSSLTVVAATAAQLAFTTQPVNTADGVLITPAVAVAVRDAFGNPVTSTAPVTLAIGSNPASGILKGNLTTNAVSGVASFNNLQIYEVGSGYTLTAASPSLTGATSTSFDITQAIGDYRSVATGLWGNTNTWARWDGSAWVTPATAPNAGSGTILIRSPDVVTVVGEGGDQIRVAAGGQLNITTSLTLTTDGPGVDLDVYGTVNNAGTIIVSGTTIAFQAGGKYQHNYASGNSVIPPAAWATNSTCEIIGYTTGTTAPTGLGQSFGNFTWNCPGQTSDFPLSGSLTTVNGDLAVVSTGTGSLRLTAGTALTLSIGGSLSVQGGRLALAAGGSSFTPSVTVHLTNHLSVTGGILDVRGTSANGSGTITLNVGGDVTVSGSGTIATTVAAAGNNINFNKSGAQSYSNSGTVGSQINWTVNSGSTVDLGVSAISGSSATFTVVAGGGLKTGHASGLNGNITVGGTKTFAAGASYTYNGIIDQVTGTLLPATITGALTMANGSGSGVTLSQNTALNTPGVCTVNNGAILTVGGTIAFSGSGTFNLSAGATLACAHASGLNGNITTTTRNFSPAANYVFNGIVGQVTGNLLPTTLTGTLTMDNGNDTGVTLSQSTVLNTPGACVVNDGAILTMGSAIVLSGTGAFTLNSGGRLTCAHPSGLDGNIAVSGTKTFGAEANYTYNGSAAQVTGSLLPATLNDLSIANAAGVTVNSTHTVSGVCTVESGALLRGAGTLNGSLVINGTVAPGSSVGQLTTGSETWNGSSIYNAEVNDATGAAGTGYDNLLVSGTGSIDVQSSSGSPLALNLISFNGGSPGSAANFNPDNSYAWNIATAGSGGVQNFAANKFALSYTPAQFQNDLKGGVFSVAQSGNNVQVQFAPNNAPVAYATNFTRNKGSSYKINIANLLATSTSDADGDARGLVSVSGAGHGTLATNGTFILYTPSDNSDDTFTYTVGDVRPAYRVGDTHRTASGTITITVVTAGGIAMTPVVNGGTATMSFAGIPGYQYDIQRTTDLTPTVTWTTLQTTNAPANGLFDYSESALPTAYYRLILH